jgi:hypothetical protein
MALITVVRENRLNLLEKIDLGQRSWQRALSGHLGLDLRAKRIWRAQATHDNGKTKHFRFPIGWHAMNMAQAILRVHYHRVGTVRCAVRAVFSGAQYAPCLARLRAFVQPAERGLGRRSAPTARHPYL